MARQIEQIWRQKESQNREQSPVLPDRLDGLSALDGEYSVWRAALLSKSSHPSMSAMCAAIIRTHASGQAETEHREQHPDEPIHIYPHFCQNYYRFAKTFKRSI